MNEIVREETSTTKNFHQRKKRHSQRIQSSRTLYSNDESMIDTNKFKFYFEHLWKNLSEENRRSSICLDSLWFSMYKSKVTKDKVLKWIKMKKILKKKYVFIPIVCWGHWSLLILCNFCENRQPNIEKPFMLLLDSLHQANPKRLEPDIRRFVLDICRTEARDENKEAISKIPLLILLQEKY
ncbi:uncharacterized protein LOC120279516 [Dioscorea cayenensis subsp. rotundata]|uniref:Uncharacterized protein LOC120279516 n=1 Tax=Dioscorea cayennensis subsp. rotundata TaxID=55577 RepID=A0AB40CQM1_DIOCR|nr:uncharacterized protein LOC120279516 [Dioscorea cayenensis subsp. rotundata]XP_039142381.1 uncharacterized protein LOC120279516 [Dioscorea cayenensis subsp. rotundata]